MFYFAVIFSEIKQQIVKWYVLLYFRLYESKLGVIRPPEGIGRYKMFKHEDRESSPKEVRYETIQISAGKRKK